MQREIPAPRPRGGLHRLALRGEPRLIALAKILGARRAQARQRRPCRENRYGPRRETSPRRDRRSSAHGLPRPPRRAPRTARRSLSGSREEIADQHQLRPRRDGARRRQRLRRRSAGAARISANRSITSRAAIGRASPSRPDPLAAAHRKIGERQDQHGRAVALGGLARVRSGNPWTPSGRTRATASAPPPIRARARRRGSPAPSGASRCDWPARPRRTGGTARNSRPARRAGVRARRA